MIGTFSKQFPVLSLLIWARCQMALKAARCLVDHTRVSANVREKTVSLAAYSLVAHISHSVRHFGHIISTSIRTPYNIALGRHLWVKRGT
jgi:hypothetical protein